MDVNHEEKDYCSFVKPAQISRALQTVVLFKQCSEQTIPPLE